MAYGLRLLSKQKAIVLLQAGDLTSVEARQLGAEYPRNMYGFPTVWKPETDRDGQIKWAVA